MKPTVDPWCRCEDRVSVAGVVTYCPSCRDKYATPWARIASWWKRLTKTKETK